MSAPAAVRRATWLSRKSPTVATSSPTSRSKTCLTESSPSEGGTAGWVSLRPRLYDTLAIVHRAGAILSPAAQLMIELATARIQEIIEPV